MFIVGEASIIGMDEMVLEEPHALFPSASLAEVAALADRLPPGFHEGATFVSLIRSWVIQTPGLLMVIDTGAGNDKPRPASPRFDHLDTPFLDRMGAAGLDPDAVDLVICTHLHVDHVGWNTRWHDGRWVPTFPNARHVFPKVEVHYWHDGPGAAVEMASRRQPFVDSVLPLLDRADTSLVLGDETLAPGVSLVPLPGHSPGMMGVRLRSGEQACLFIADAMHSPVQIWRPEWSSRYCADPLMAQDTRRSLLSWAADTGALLMAAHFGDTGAVRVFRSGDGFDFIPEPSMGIRAEALS